MTLMLAGFLAGSALFAAAPNYSDWTPTNGKLKKTFPGLITVKDGVMTLKGIPDKEWIMFNYIGVKSEEGKTIRITFKASGKGKVHAGYFGYREKYSLAKSESKVLALEEKEKDFKLEFPLIPAVKIVRARFNIAPGSEINISNFKAEIVK